LWSGVASRSRFTWTRNPAFGFSDQLGGPHGGYYTDINAVRPAAAAHGASRSSNVDIGGMGGVFAAITEPFSPGSHLLLFALTFTRVLR
jgi:hypothetical protein